MLGGGVLALGMVAGGAAAAAAAAPSSPSSSSPAACRMAGGKIKHVIYIQFDNVHYTRDNPRVPSDLQQMPNLLTFITSSGALLSQEHTPLIAHTANDIVTSETGLYGSGTGTAVANEYHYYTSAADGSSDEAGDFAYWTDPIVDYFTSYAGTPVGDSHTTLVGHNGKNPPAPWVPYTRAGCDFGSVAAADTELENQAPDVAKVFGAKSADAKEADNPKLSAKAAADYEGLSVHCARQSALCAKYHSVPDTLAAEPGGYHGYRALFGAKYLDPLMSPAGPVRSLNGAVIKDSAGDIGFPGYDGMTGPSALAYTLDMQTHGVPVTFTYLSDVHDSWTTGAGLGPGSAQYESQLRTENKAFGTFFSGLAAHGITKANTLFVVTADEGDHFVGGAPSNPGCNGVTVVCHYKNVGEVDGNLTGMLAAKGVTTPFDVQADSAPIIYVHHQPGRTTAAVRALERAAAKLTAKDVATGKTVRVTNYLADPVEMKLLHMVTGDPKRTATLALFGNPDFWLDSSLPASCGTKVLTCEPAGGDAWNHGDVASKINTTFLGFAGPGVRHLGATGSIWSDHTDIQPTMMELLGLRDDYTPDGRVLPEVIKPSALRPSLKASYPTLVRLGDAFTAINAAVGPFGLDTLRASTVALSSTSASDVTYTKLESLLAGLGSQRDMLVAGMKTMLYGAAFGGRPVNVSKADDLIKAAADLLSSAKALP
ncbi:hypothetical protein EAS64_01815 [Trebonia kvetii]|uniref:Phosphoesterase n=1 Tax=Trebonia kvetii TaxID=2480626 RepID=A0A6P2C9H0_9ACTN|nr:hypothetical protein [Trebonia kvetii]TVZ06203.1 hypothetical protein EAS64_01815 [Trebonia kvetii]